MVTDKSIGVLWIGLLCINLVSPANGDDYLIDKESDGLILDLTAIFFAFCILFLVVMVALAVVVYRKAKTGLVTFASEKSPECGTTNSSPFHGGTYLISKNPIYLPGRPSSNANGTKDNNERDSAYLEGTSGEGATEESQIGATCEMKKEKVIQTYKNPAYEESGYWSLGSESVTMKALEFEEVPIDS
ncbi:uncharacterized protein LOC114951573 isoform X2 [Acropora millepora]|uniref:uncharacterized protein LOC114951573 isoform X2 n=1 Tax=Acropora millepora TaxID=45264 RepID=UPI001CF1A29A|nr:uncharacterized protein LOC114951573 isoform X2 [Acropora millepora]